mmetsp:Transcript_51948/g.86561  ORF Transcript_51948/g.86561 Transcript_51948/m.86561 type:complete len:206 (-) Transcript_51948:741-1358(-)
MVLSTCASRASTSSLRRRCNSSKSAVFLSNSWVSSWTEVFAARSCRDCNSFSRSNCRILASMLCIISASDSRPFSAISCAIFAAFICSTTSSLATCSLDAASRTSSSRRRFSERSSWISFSRCSSSLSCAATRVSASVRFSSAVSMRMPNSLTAPSFFSRSFVSLRNSLSSSCSFLLASFASSFFRSSSRHSTSLYFSSVWIFSE